MTPAKMKSGVKLPSHCSMPPATSNMSMAPMPPHPTTKPTARLGKASEATVNMLADHA